MEIKQNNNWTYANSIPKAADLLKEGPRQNRYLTIPGSRVVVNPFNFESQARETTQAMYSDRPSMPLNLGYCDPFMGEGRGIELPNVMLMTEKMMDGQNAGVETLWQAGLKDASAWTISGEEGKDYTLSFRGDSAVMEVLKTSGALWQNMDTEVTVDMEDAFLTVTIDSFTHGGRLAVKINDGLPDDRSLIETNMPGTYTFDLQKLTGWTGRKTFLVRVYTIGRGAAAAFSGLTIQKGTRAFADAKDFSTSWRPDFLGFQAAYPRGSRVEGTDFFYDEKTVVRDMRVAGDKPFMLCGDYNGVATLHGSTVLVDRGNFKYAVTISADVQPVFYSSLLEAMAGGKGEAAPSGRAHGVWAYHLDAMPESGVLRAAVSFDTKLAADADVVALSRKPGDDCAAHLAQRTAQWDELLTRVPRPQSFELADIDAKGVTAADVKQSYYEAWVQLMGNPLPSNPELDFHYPIMATGKASLWGYGSPKCSYAATWDALYGISAYAQIDADAAWGMYKGLMSLVGEDGQIAGESLPPNNARVAWILYTAKADQAALKEIQPALERHLTWRFENPRWIYLDVTPDALERDMDFVSSALVDVRYLMRINEELGLESENAKWQPRIEKLYEDMKEWFFSDETEYPVQYFTLNGNKRRQGNASWVTKALYVPDIRQPEVEEMLRLFKAIYHPDRPFCGVGGTKYEPYNYTLVGLLEQGRMEEGRIMAQAAVRDITLCGDHSEGYCYRGDETVPLPEGVRPSLFGVNMFIDNIWLMNGLRMDDGMPVFARYFDRDGGVENLKVDGKIFNFRKDGGIYTYGGTAVDGVKTMEVAENRLGFPFAGTNIRPLD